MKKLMSTLSAHIEGEEAHDLVHLERSIMVKAEDPVKVSEELAREFERTKMFVPTRSHPLAPQTPVGDTVVNLGRQGSFLLIYQPYETALGLLVAPIDKLTDLFRKFPREP
jgi:hypothetical protein